MTSVNDVNCSHKEIYCRCCRGPRYTSETSYYKKFKTEQLKDHVKSNKNLVKQFFGERGGGGDGQFSWRQSSGWQFSWGHISGGIFSGTFFWGSFFPGAFFRAAGPKSDKIASAFLK